MEQERAGTKWRAGMREKRREDRTGEARQKRKRKGRTEKPEKSRSATSFESSNHQSATFSEHVATFSESDHNSERSAAGEKPKVTVKPKGKRAISNPPTQTDSSDTDDEPTLTDSSNGDDDHSENSDEDEEPTGTIKTRVFVKRARPNPPPLTDSSDEDEEPKDTIKTKRVKELTILFEASSIWFFIRL